MAHDRHIRDIMADDRLTAEGVKQAERLRDRLATTGEIKADALLASSYPRARQTAEIIAPALGLPVILEDDLQEWRPGDNGGMYWDEYIEKYGRDDPFREPFRTTAPGGEYWSQFMLRVISILHRIAHEYEDKSIVLVCHGGIVDGSLISFFGLSALYRPHLSLDTDNTAITHWKHFQENGAPRWQLMKYNDALHLQYDIRGQGE
ncbi:MAG TPA: histidine phosphatase family protein [Chloroflexia bacterium]|nr:histidine phosphatase family protein [Chloroflexia bacterium]